MKSCAFGPSGLREAEMILGVGHPAQDATVAACAKIKSIYRNLSVGMTGHQTSLTLKADAGKIQYHTRRRYTDADSGRIDREGQ